MQETATFKVRCSGRLHRITARVDGPVTLHDHSRADLAAERIMIALGGDPCRCLQILEAWRNRDRGSKYLVLPPQAVAVLNGALQRGWIRRHRRRGSFYQSDPLTRALSLRLCKQVADIIHGQMRLVSYRASKSPNQSLIRVVPRNLPASVTSPPDISRRRGRICIKLKFYRWHNHVYKRGLAVVGGVFILDVLSQDDAGYIVLAGRQRKDLSIAAARAYVRPNAVGENTLEWLD